MFLSRRDHVDCRGRSVAEAYLLKMVRENSRHPTNIIGHATGHQETGGITRGTFVLGSYALKKFRNNDILEGIRILEAHYYSTAVVLLEDPKWRNSFIVETFVPDLIEYRRKFAAKR